MRITAEFVTSVARLDQLPSERLPEIALVGRSNVGKSSLINTLVDKAGLARTSNTPGRTQTLNYYRITPGDKPGKPFFVVDMPGYGFAAVNQASRAQWSKLIEQYLSSQPTLCGIIQLIDLRHPPQPLDYTMAERLHNLDRRHLLVGTKADKLGKTKVTESLVQIATSLRVESQSSLAFSAQTKYGRDQLWRWVMDTIATPPKP